jgi:hypothetical protein
LVNQMTYFPGKAISCSSRAAGDRFNPHIFWMCQRYTSFLRQKKCANTHTRRPDDVIKSGNSDVFRRPNVIGNTICKYESSIWYQIQQLFIQAVDKTLLAFEDIIVSISRKISEQR